MTDLSFNKKFEREKKSSFKSISKSIDVDTYYLLFVIMVTECDVLSPSAKSQKRGGTANVNYLKVKNGVAY